MAIDPGDRRERLLEAGLALLTEARLADVPAAEIARRAGVAHGLLFHYFGTKEVFQAEVVRVYFERIRSQFAANSEVDHARWLRRDLELLIDSFVNNERMAHLIAGAPESSPELATLVRELQEVTVQRYATRLGCPRVSPLTRLALLGYQNGSMSIVRAWLETRKPSRAVLVDFLVAQFVATVEALRVHDRSITVDPAAFRTT
jgi:AcrR family transcriptional regulator